MAYVNDTAFMGHATIDNKLGYEKHTKNSSDGSTNVIFVIKPFIDLSIRQDVELCAFFPVTYKQLGGLTVSVVDRKNYHYFQSFIDMNNGELCLPWMEQARYHLPVWFHTCRNLLKIPSVTPWKSNPLTSPEFQQCDVDWPVYFNYNANNCTTNNLEDVLLPIVGSGCTRGKRNYMEDVDIKFESLRVNDRGRSISVFGVLDGHGGKDCAHFSAENLPSKIAALMRTENNPCPTALLRAFLQTDKEFLESDVVNNSGSTANVMVYDQMYNVFHIANTGDTRAVLSRRGGKAVDLSIDRKATDPEEVARIAKAGGFVANGRVMGSLAVSRALGDLQLKEQGTHKLQRVVIPDPEMTSLFPIQSDEFIIVATDGLWDVMQSQQAITYARDLLMQEGLLLGEKVSSTVAELQQGGTGNQLLSDIKEKLGRIAHNMAVHAVSNLNSMDNVTVMIILLHGGPVSAPAGPLPRKKINPVPELVAIEQRNIANNNSNSSSSNSNKNGIKNLDKANSAIIPTKNSASSSSSNINNSVIQNHSEYSKYYNFDGKNNTTNNKSNNRNSGSLAISATSKAANNNINMQPLLSPSLSKAELEVIRSLENNQLLNDDDDGSGGGKRTGGGGGGINSKQEPPRTLFFGRSKVNILEDGSSATATAANDGAIATTSTTAATRNGVVLGTGAENINTINRNSTSNNNHINNNDNNNNKDITTTKQASAATTTVATTAAPPGDEEDDLMNFLQDDSNF